LVFLLDQQRLFHYVGKHHFVNAIEKKDSIDWKIDYGWAKDYAAFETGEGQLGGGLDRKDKIEKW